MHLVLDSAWMKALGWSLISSFWQMAVLWFFYILAVSLVQLRASTRHTLAIVLVLVGSVWFGFSFFNFWLSGNTNYLVFMDPASGSLRFLNTLREFLVNNLPVFSFAYLGMLLFLTLRYIHFYRFSKHFKSAGTQKIPPSLKVFVGSIATRMGIRKEISLRLSSIIQTPMTVGFWKPVILVPLAMINQLTIQQVEAVLLHELAHIRRNDYLLNLFIAIVDVFFFFNPFTRLLTNSIRRDREHCCDDWVMQFQYDPLVYASALLNLEKNRRPGMQLAIAAVGRDHQLLLERIRRVNGQGRFSISFNFRVAGLFVLALLIGCLFSIKTPDPVLTPLLASYQNNASASTREIIPVSYVENEFTSKESKVKTFAPRLVRMDIKKTEKTTKTLINVNYVPEPESGDNDIESTTGTATLGPDTRDYSITEATPATAPVAAGGYNYPYVPNSSFTYKITMDTTSEVALEQLNTLANMQQTVNTAVTSKLVTVPPTTIIKLQSEVDKSFKVINWQQENQDAIALLPEAERRAVLSRVNGQIRNLQKAIRQNPLPAKELQKKLMGEQVKLQELSRKQIRISQAKLTVVHI